MILQKQVLQAKKAVLFIFVDFFMVSFSWNNDNLIINLYFIFFIDRVLNL